MKRQHPSILYLSEPEWQRLLLLLPDSRASKWPLRAVLNALLHQQRTGCRWCELPACLPPAHVVCYRLMKWQADGTWQQLTQQVPHRYRPPVAPPPAPAGVRGLVINLGWIKHAGVNQSLRPGQPVAQG